MCPRQNGKRQNVNSGQQQTQLFAWLGKALLARKPQCFRQFNHRGAKRLTQRLQQTV